MQKDRPRAEIVPEAVKLLKDVKLAKPGTLTIFTAGGAAFGINATDNQKIIVGSEPDIGRLVADGLGLELEVVQVAWADWPLGLSLRAKYDAAAISKRHRRPSSARRKFDFSTYRQGPARLLCLAGKSAIEEISKPESVATGLG